VPLAAAFLAAKPAEFRPALRRAVPPLPTGPDEATMVV